MKRKRTKKEQRPDKLYNLAKCVTAIASILTGINAMLTQGPILVQLVAKLIKALHHLAS